MNNKLKGKIALITGGASGIGKAMSLLFAEHGATICILDIDKKKADETVELINSNNGSSEFYFADVSNHNAINKVGVEIISKYKKIDILVNNAGIAHIGNVETTSESAMDRLYQVNIKGVYNCLSAVIPQMVRQGSGTILNMSSIATMVGLQDRFAYSMSKAAVENMTYTVAKDYLKSGIRCNAIAPARVHTPFVDNFLKTNYPGKEKEMFEQLSNTQPIGRMGKPEEIAELALYLCSDDSSFITGTCVPIDGGFIKLNT